MDALQLLKKDHETIEKLFARFEKGQKRSKPGIVEKAVMELNLHTRIEEEIFYPRVREADEELEEIVLESFEEHGIVKRLCSELEELEEDDERFEAKMTVLIDVVRHHLEEEERRMFKMVRKELSKDELRDLGNELNRAKKTFKSEMGQRRAA